MIGNLIVQLLLWGGVIYLALNLCALLFSDRLLFQPQIPGYKHLTNEVRIPTSDGETINAIWLEHPSAKYTLLFSHGNTEDLSTVYPFMKHYHELGYSLLMYDYRGYGTSDGTPSYRKVKADASAAYRWLVDKKKIAPNHIIAHGRSLGGAVAIWTAAHHTVGGLIVESSFASAFRVKTGWALTPWDKFDSLKLLRKVKCPVFIMHGTRDEILPFWHGKALYKAAPEPKQHLWIEEGEHMNYAYVAGEHYFNSVEAFIASLSVYQSTSIE